MIPVRGFEGKTRRRVRPGPLRPDRRARASSRRRRQGRLVWDEKLGRPRGSPPPEGFAVQSICAIADWKRVRFAGAVAGRAPDPIPSRTGRWSKRPAAAGVEIIGDIELFARTVNAAPAS